MNLLLTGEDQPQADQPNGLAEGPPMKILILILHLTHHNCRHGAFRVVLLSKACTDKQITRSTECGLPSRLRTYA
jgi:hypothetical protein